MAVHEDESQTGAAPGATRDPNQLAHKHKSKDPSLIFSFLNLSKWALPLFVYLLVMAVEDGSRFLLSGSHLNLVSPRRAIAQQVGAYSVIGSAHIRLLGVRAAPAPPSIVLADALLGPIDTEADTSPEDGDDPFDEDDEDMEDAYLASVASSNNADTLDDIVGMDLYLEEIEEDADEKLGLLRRQTVTLSPLLTISSSASTPETTRTISTPSPTLTSTRASTASSSGVPPSQTSSIPLPTTSTVTLDTLPYNFTLAAVNFGLPTNGAAEPLVLGQAGVTSGMSFHVTSVRIISFLKIRIFPLERSSNHIKIDVLFLPVQRLSVLISNKPVAPRFHRSRRMDYQRNRCHPAIPWFQLGWVQED